MGLFFNIFFIIILFCYNMLSKIQLGRYFICIKDISVCGFKRVLEENEFLNGLFLINYLILLCVVDFNYMKSFVKMFVYSVYVLLMEEG